MNRPALHEYVEKLTKKYQQLPSVKYQIGYPGNYKQQEVNNEVKYNISKYQPSIANSGTSLNMKDNAWISSVETESDIILKIMKPWGGDKDNTWAYITSGGTEGNLAGIQFGLKAFYPQKPILIYSHEGHYSISKGIELTKGQFYTMLQIPTLRNGEIDCKQIAPAIRYVTAQDASPGDMPPVVVMATLGTTMKGACDDVCSILNSLYSVGLTRDKIFVHLDAAFHGAFWELDKQNPNYQLGEEFNSLFNSLFAHFAHFSLTFRSLRSLFQLTSLFNSLFAIHQTQESLYEKGGYRECIGVSDIGVTSSRNGLNAISWMIRYLQFDWQEEYDDCQKNVKLLLEKFHSLGIETFVNPASLTVCIPKLPIPIVDKYCLACYDDCFHLGEMCHVIVCPHVTEHVIETFVSDIKACIGELNNTSFHV